MPFIANVTPTQLSNPTPSSASVQITFTVTGILTDLVEIYVRGASDQFSDPVQRVELSPPEINYTSDEIELQAGTQFFFQLCPRNKTGDRLDDEVEGQPFETFCTAQIPFTTHVSSQPPQPPQPTPTPPTPRPVVSGVRNIVTTKVGYSRVRLKWDANRNYNAIQVIRRAKTNDNIAFLGSLPINSTGTEDITVSPNTTYTYMVETCFITPQHRDCVFASSAEVTTLSFPTLRQFLEIHGFDPRQGTRSLRPLLSTSLRSIMNALDN
jgi:hypothetical protein